jgi:hypothetical protein
MPALAAFLRCLTDGFLALYARGDLTDVTVPR